MRVAYCNQSTIITFKAIDSSPGLSLAFMILGMLKIGLVAETPLAINPTPDVASSALKARECGNKG